MKSTTHKKTRKIPLLYVVKNYLIRKIASALSGIVDICIYIYVNVVVAALILQDEIDSHHERKGYNDYNKVLAKGLNLTFLN